MADKKLPFTAHLAELRDRIIKILVAGFAGFLISYAFKEQIFGFLLKPLNKALPPGSSVIYTGVTEAFFTYLWASLYLGIFIASPFIIYQVWAFVAPGLYMREKRAVLPFIFISIFFFLAGAAFAYYAVFPFAFKFLLSFGAGTLKPLPSAKEYLSFATKLLLAFGIVFEFPTVLLLLSRLGIVTAEFLRQYRRYAILGFFVLAAFITPPDVVSQLLVAVPLVFLYEFSILLVKLIGGPRKGGEEIQEEDAEEE